MTNALSATICKITVAGYRPLRAGKTLLFQPDSSKYREEIFQSLETRDQGHNKEAV